MSRTRAMSVDRFAVGASLLALALTAGCFPSQQSAIQGTTTTTGTADGEAPSTLGDTAEPTGPTASSSGPAEPACDNGALDDDESDVDCGGSCPPCNAGRGCRAHGDCSSGYCGDGATCEVLRSCREILEAGNSVDGTYWLDFDGEGPDSEAEVLCDMTRDGGGWSLVLKINSADELYATESFDVIRERHNPHLLLDEGMSLNRGVASHGTRNYASLVRSDSLGRFTLVAADDPERTATWFKAAPERSVLEEWFGVDQQPTPVCLDVALTDGCTTGTIRGDAVATAFEGMDLAAFGFTTTAPLEMRLDNQVNVSHDLSGVCSQTQDFDDNAWPDHALDSGQWGNGMLVWLR